MDERYPYIRFVIDAARIIAGAVALIILFSGTLRACHHGGVGGLLLALVLAAVGYIVTMVQIETLRVLVDIADATRQGSTKHASATPPPHAPLPPRSEPAA
jgi:hypothetical protein